MYGCYESGIVEGRESFPASWIIGENLLYVSSWTVAGWILWPVKVGGWPVATLGWLFFVLVLQVLLRQSCDLSQPYLQADEPERFEANTRIETASAEPTSPSVAVSIGPGGVALLVRF